ncbi:unnamed protein product [Hyaloperonospora brassicae]|uniref:PH domain-containing protein n=1 Tax=Hyaloperonospora brassicae TaxID=162125 RepID=A0AAV0UQ37_HYABA|nr:unnamed protein product [Hyaloperonospora brassicae]
MTCGKLLVQSCNLLWFPSTVYLLGAAQPNIAATKDSTAFNLVIQRPRIAGGTLILALDATVKLIRENGMKDTDRHVLRLQYGPSSKHLILRASSAQERQQWLVAIAAAMPPPGCSDHGDTGRTGNVPRRRMRARVPKRAKKAQRPPFQSVPLQRGCSIRRVVRQNVPAAMQVVLAFGQIIASAH